MDFPKPQYINWLIEERGVVFEDGVPLKCFIISYDRTNDTILDDWAIHVRRHYISDKELDESIETIGINKNEYLKHYIIPQKEDKPRGPTTISTEIAEILLYDLFEYILQYTALRGRHWDKPTPTSTIEGSDVIAVKMINKGKASVKDELCVVEVKATLTEGKYEILKKAKEHSDNDSLRFSVSLDFLRKKYKNKGEIAMMHLVDRFQQKANLQYIQKFFAAGVISRKEIKNKTIVGISGADLKITLSNQVFLIHGEKLMELAHDVYERITK